MAVLRRDAGAGSPAVTEAVVVFDVVVNQACLVEDFHGERGSLHRVGQFDLVGSRCGGSALDGVISGERDERSRPLAAARQPVVSDCFMEGQADRSANCRLRSSLA